MSNYRIVVDGDTRLNFSANFAQASSPILMEGDSTPFQVADARHSAARAAEMLIGYCHSEGGPCVEDGEEYTVEKVEDDAE